MKLSAVLMIPVLLAPLLASAHKDRILTLRSDGSIPEVPAEYSPVNLKVEFTPKSPKVTIHIGSHTSTLPGCVMRLIKSKSSRDIALHGSWYHDESRLPYYINATFYSPDSPHDQSRGEYVSILLNLRNAEIIEITQVEKRLILPGSTYRRQSLGDVCGESSAV